MINWFSPESWGAPICADAPRCETPVGETCGRCGGAITETDEGVTLPTDGGPLAFHLACHLKAVLPHWMWPLVRLVPEASDGLVNGRFECQSCGMVWSAGAGWMRRLR
jgi:hypothetical protein